MVPRFTLCHAYCNGCVVPLDDAWPVTLDVDRGFAVVYRQVTDLLVGADSEANDEASVAARLSDPKILP